MQFPWFILIVFLLIACIDRVEARKKQKKKKRSFSSSESSKFPTTREKFMMRLDGVCRIALWNPNASSSLKTTCTSEMTSEVTILNVLKLTESKAGDFVNLQLRLGKDNPAPMYSHFHQYFRTLATGGVYPDYQDASGYSESLQSCLNNDGMLMIGVDIVGVKRFRSLRGRATKEMASSFAHLLWASFFDDSRLGDCPFSENVVFRGICFNFDSESTAILMDTLKELFRLMGSKRTGFGIFLAPISDNVQISSLLLQEIDALLIPSAMSTVKLSSLVSKDCSFFLSSAAPQSVKRAFEKSHNFGGFHEEIPKFKEAKTDRLLIRSSSVEDEPANVKTRENEKKIQASSSDAVVNKAVFYLSFALLIGLLAWLTFKTFSRERKELDTFELKAKEVNEGN